MLLCVCVWQINTSLYFCPKWTFYLHSAVIRALPSDLFCHEFDQHYSYVSVTQAWVLKALRCKQQVFRDLRLSAKDSMVKTPLDLLVSLGSCFSYPLSFSLMLWPEMTRINQLQVRPHWNSSGFSRLEAISKDGNPGPLESQPNTSNQMASVFRV